MEFFYDGQIRRYVTQFMRIFIGFKYQSGDETQTAVPVMYGDMTRQVAAIIRENSENKMPSVPRIACYITGLELDRTRLADATYVSKINIQERDYVRPDEADYREGVREYKGRQGNAYTVERLMPTPFVLKMKADGGKTPHLAAILVGSDGASITYVAAKEKDCEEVGFNSTILRFDATISEENLIAEVEKINQNKDIDGLIVQLPLPKHINEQRVTDAVIPEKDVDGFHPVNLGKLVLGMPTFVSATPAGIMEMLKRYGIETAGKHCVVVGRSNIVGTPMSILLSRNTDPGNCTVTLCHSRTKDLASFTREADILVVALGRPEFIKADMVKEGAVVIDVGITRLDDASAPKGYRIVGDVDYAAVAPKSSYITPVPGGVGRMTIAALLSNTMLAARFRNSPAR
jgi:methylenetetrahydrofolate dehydrogenase (NADP+)/methenyltetrahydrofolate cyclohydrolase